MIIVAASRHSKTPGWAPSTGASWKAWCARELWTALPFCVQRRVQLPLVPATVWEQEPATVWLLVITFKEEFPKPGSEAGKNVPVAPVGSPLTENAVNPVHPLFPVREIVQLRGEG